MADDIKAAAGEIADSGKDAAALLTGLTNMMNTNGVAAGALSGLWSNVANSMLKGSGALRELSDSMRNGTAMSSTMTNAMTSLSAVVLGTSRAFEGFDSNRYASGFQSVSNQISTAVDPILKMAGGMQKLAGMLDIKTPEGITKLRSLLSDMYGAVGQNVDAAQTFQNSFLQMSLASGQAGALFRAAKDDLSGLNGVLKDQIDATTGVARATGIAYPAVNDFYMKMGQIPGALQALTAATGGATGSVQAWQAAIDVATASGMTLEQAITQQKKAYDLFGATGDQALEFMARQAELSTRAQVPLEQTTGYLNKMGDAFKFLGDNTKGSNQIFLDMFNNLRNSGVGVGPAIEQIEHVGESISKLTVAQKAFISSRSGGPGGLMGAAQIEKELREGKTEDVFNKMRQSFLNQVGGKVVTLDEASRSQAAASQFEKQRRMLMSGAFGGMAASEDQATNLLNMLAKPKADVSVKEQKDLLSGMRDQGKTVADQNRTLFTGIGAGVESIKAKGGLELLAAVKAGFGVNNNQIKASMDQDKVSATETSATATTEATQGRDISAQTTSKNIGDITSAYKYMTSNIGESLNNAVAGVVKPTTATGEAAGQTAAYNQLLHQRRTTPAGSLAAAAHQASAGTTTAFVSSTQPSHPPSPKENRPVVNVVVYVDGKSTHATQQVNQDLGDHPLTNFK
jgi:hypothetical protein